MSNKEFHNTASNAGIIGVTAFAGAIFGFILQLLVAYYFGASSTTDAFFMAQSTSELLGKLLMGGSITAVFIPLFVHRLAKGSSSDAWDLGLNIVNTMACIYMIFIAIIWAFAGSFVHIIAPGFSGDTYTLTVSLLRVLLPSFFFLFLVEFATSMLHSFKQFALPSLLRIIAPSISIISIIFLVRQLGIYSLAVGVVAGSIVQIGILAWGLVRQGMHYRFFINLKDPAIKKVIHLVYPFIMSALVTQGAGIVYRVLVSTLEEGSLSALKYAEKITQLITIIFLNSVTLVIYPLLSEKASIGDYSGIRSTIASSMRLIVFVTLPLILAVAILRHQIVAIVYQRGSFSEQDAAYTAIALLYLVLGLTTTGISSIFGHAVLALQETRAAVAITICSQAVAIGLFVLLVPHMNFAGLALASSLVPLSSALLYYLYLTRFVANLHTIFLHATYIKTITLSVVSSMIIYAVASIGLAPVFQVVIALTAAASVYLFLAKIWRIEEMAQLWNILHAKRKKLTSASL